MSGMGLSGLRGGTGGSKTPAAVCFEGGRPERLPPACGSSSSSRRVNSCGMTQECYARSALARKKMRATRCEPGRPRWIESRSSASRFNLAGRGSVFGLAARLKLSREAALASSTHNRDPVLPAPHSQAHRKALCFRLRPSEPGFTRVAANSAAKPAPRI
jgi:hypothetical protein